MLDFRYVCQGLKMETLVSIYVELMRHPDKNHGGSVDEALSVAWDVGMMMFGDEFYELVNDKYFG